MKSPTVDSHDLAVGEQFGQNIERKAIVGIVEDRHQHQLVGDVEIGVAGGQALSVER